MGLGVLDDRVMEHVPGLSCVIISEPLADVVCKGRRDILMIPKGLRLLLMIPLASNAIGVDPSP